MFLPELTERLSRLLGFDRAELPSETKEIEPRPLTGREAGWIQAIFDASTGWEEADISKTTVVAERRYSDVSISLALQSPTPQNPHGKAIRNSFGELWIQTSDRLVMNVQLSEWEGRLQELYFFVIDPEHPRRIISALPESSTEVSCEAVGFGR